MNQSKKKRQAKKDKSTSKKCTLFCKNDYAAELYKQNPSNYETKTRQRSIDNQLCRRSFCDEDCKGPAYKFHDNTLFQTLFRNKLTNGFIDTFTSKEVEMLKKRGALSGCINLMKTNTPLQPNNKYDIFHKEGGKKRKNKTQKKRRKLSSTRKRHKKKLRKRTKQSLGL